MTCEPECVKSKLSPCAFGLAVGVVKGLYMLVFAWAAHFFGMGGAVVEHMGSLYHGVNASVMGGLIGAVYGLICGFIFGYLLGWFYNKFLCYCNKS